MRRPYTKSLLILVILASAVYFSASWFGGSAPSESAGVFAIDSTVSGKMAASYKKGSYDEYLGKHRNLKYPDAEILIEAENFRHTRDMETALLTDYEGSEGRAVHTGDTGSIEWEFDVANEGLYHIGIRYFTTKGKGSDIERELRIDGHMPFSEARSILFNRIWKNEENGLERDGRGNDLIPSQVEVPAWQETLLKDATGFYEEPYLFYFSRGRHTLSLTSLKEPLAIDYLKLIIPHKTPGYDELASTYKQKGYKPVEDTVIKVQGEAAAYKSSPSLVPYNDRSSPATEPFHVSKLRNNVMGAYAWRMPGQWIEWEVEVPKDGLYTIAIKNKQNYMNGIPVLRKLYVDGVIPFREARRIAFPYAGSWRTTVLGKDRDNPYLFYLEKGKHRIRLEVTLGDLSQVIRAVEASIFELNAMYRKIISFTGTTPDTFRDYHLERRIPEMSEVFRRQGELLDAMARMIEGPEGRKNERTAMLDKLARQLKDMADRPETAVSRLAPFKENIGGLGAWLLTVTEQPLAIDYWMAASPDARLPNADAGLLKKAATGVRKFAASFSEQYDFTNEGETDAAAITVWVTQGRDQITVVKRLIDNEFTPSTGIRVNLRLVGGEVLLPATFSGNGPDIALEVGNDLPLNFATRNAVQDLSVFPDFKQVTERFHPSAMVPYEFNGKYFALPDTQTFPVLFYRKDIIEEELKLKVPETWDEVTALIPKLQKRSLEFGLPSSEMTSLGVNPIFAMLLYQRGGDLYHNGGMSSALDSEASIQSFKRWTDFYVNYKLPVRFDFANRFRTGEMPIGIFDYTMVNKLAVFAPEIRGLWDFMPVPGIKAKDGTIRRETGGSGTAAVMFKNTADKDAAWTFLKWWSSSDIQLKYGREMEVRLGVSARYPTANIEALKQLPWQTRDMLKLTEQMQWIKGIPEVPGGYFTGRHLDNAFRQVVVQNGDPREAVDDYVRYINEEITLKRKEFNLPYEK